MSAPRKPNSPGKDKPVPALTRLKSLPAADREVIYGWCSDAKKTLTDVRGEIRSVYSISLSSDSQLSRFRDWQFHQQRLERHNSNVENFEEAFRRANPKASAETIRNAAIAFFMSEAAASGDRDGFIDIARLDLDERSAKTKAHFKEREISLGENKFQFDAAKACLTHLAELRQIASDRALTEPQKIEAIRKRLWGTPPPTTPKPQ